LLHKAASEEVDRQSSNSDPLRASVLECRLQRSEQLTALCVLTCTGLKQPEANNLYVFNVQQIGMTTTVLFFCVPFDHNVNLSAMLLVTNLIFKRSLYRPILSLCAVLRDRLLHYILRES